MEKPNYRSVGRNSPQPTTKRSKSPKTYTGTNFPTVPSRWETKLSPDKGTQEGFGIGQRRFPKPDSFNDALPGPGYYYNDLSESASANNPSFSKKGYGNAFLSKKPKIDFVPNKAAIPGPGVYNFKSSISIEKTNKKGTVGFLPSGKGRVPYVDPLTGGARPGPGEYNLNIESVSSTRRKKKQHSMFASKVPRSSFLTSLSDAPAPGAYNPNFKELCPSTDHELIWAKSKDQRFQNLCYDNKVPGPTHYFNDLNDLEEEEAKQLSLRTVGRFTFTGPLGVRHSESNPQDKCFGGGAVGERFRNSFMGRLDVASKLPGPGWYDPLLTTNTDHMLSKHRGKDGHEDYETGREALTATFRSTSATRADMLKPLRHRTPGPAYYNPNPVTSKRFSVNVDGRWE